MQISATAPGKAILMGEHAAVYGRPALVAAVGRRVSAELTVSPGSETAPGEWVLHLPDVGVEEVVSLRALESYAQRARRAWERWAADPAGVDFGSVVGQDRAHVVKVAVGEALYEGQGVVGPGDPSTPAAREALGGRLTVRSELPVGSGFGSSAAVAASVLGVVLAALGKADDGRPVIESPVIESPAIERLGLQVERRQHGSPSGVDGMTVVRGGILFVERIDGELVASAVAPAAETGWPESVRARWQVFHSGQPEGATGEVVAAVRLLRDRSPAAFDEAMDRACEATHDLRRGLAGGDADPTMTVGAVRRFQRWLETLGVVPDAVRSRIRRIEALGGAAKISGAGSLGGSGAGSVLVYHPDPTALGAASSSDPTLFAGWDALDLGLGGPGLEIELGQGNDTVGRTPRPFSLDTP